MAQPYDPAPTSLKVMTWNVEWFYDDFTPDNRSELAKEQSAPTREYWQARLQGVAQVIASEEPSIVALQEIEDADSLAALRVELKKLGKSYRYAFINGRDTATEQDVGFLFKGGLFRYSRFEQSKTMYDSRQYYNISKHLCGGFRWSDVESPLSVLNVHLRARAEKEDLRVKQAKLARKWLELPLGRGQDVIILGDMNSEHSVGELNGDVQAIVGDDPTMVDLLAKAKDPTARTHLIVNKQFDRIYASQSMIEDGPGRDWVFRDIRILDRAVVRGRPDGQAHWDNRLQLAPREVDLSDHYPVVATFVLK